MNQETFHDGWLVKSPPIKRIWRARWRRRWFTLKQGELPGQFFLEYYTDRNCRKLKGTIDLDQCEQVDAGLRMCSRKHKLPFMFLVKTPRREYYLGADTDEELRGWVNCICQVCGLQDLTKENDNKNFYNTEPNTSSSTDINTNSFNTKDISNATQLTDLNNSMLLNNDHHQSQQCSIFDNQLDNLSIHNTYQNDDFTIRNTEYTNRETLLSDVKLEQNISKHINPFKMNSNNLLENNFETYSNFSTIVREANKLNPTKIERSISEIDTQFQQNNQQPSASGTIKKIPENLTLPENINEFIENSKPSPSLSTCSGPYIPISECFSGSPILPPTNLLNSMDPKFYDTPRNHHINIGLNLTNDQPYSPKRNNCLMPRLDSSHSSPTDSESVFTDDEWSQTESFQGTLDRNLRPSDSSIENEAIGWTYVQRFSKVPFDPLTKQGTGPPPRPPKRISTLVLDDLERSKDKECSDTENASPAIGPKDSTSYVEQSYDIPRSHRLPYYLNNINSISPKQITNFDITAQSTPNLLVVSSGGYVVKQNFYSNAAPTSIDNSIFRYDFFEQPDAPAVNRSLKPRISTLKEIKIDETIALPQTSHILNETHTANAIIKSPPNINRKLKPMTPQFDTNSMKRHNTSASSKQEEHSDEDIGSLHELPQMFFQEKHFHSRSSSMNNQPLGSSKSEDKLQYLDLDHSTSQQKSAKATSTLTKSMPRHKKGASTSEISRPEDSGIVYKTVDFLKTEAIKRIREDAELSRANSLQTEIVNKSK